LELFLLVVEEGAEEIGTRRKKSMVTGEGKDDKSGCGRAQQQRTGQ
jgi:hypothetical protein